METGGGVDKWTATKIFGRTRFELIKPQLNQIWSEVNILASWIPVPFNDVFGKRSNCAPNSKFWIIIKYIFELPFESSFSFSMKDFRLDFIYLEGVDLFDTCGWVVWVKVELEWWF